MQLFGRVVLEDQFGFPHDESLPGNVGGVNFALIAEFGEHFNTFLVLLIAKSDDIEVFLLVLKYVFVCDFRQSS